MNKDEEKPKATGGDGSPQQSIAYKGDKKPKPDDPAFTNLEQRHDQFIKELDEHLERVRETWAHEINPAAIGSTAFRQAYTKLMGSLPVIELNAKAEIATKKGSTYKYKYADLPGIVKAVRKIVNDCGFIYYWTSEPVARVTCHLVHKLGEQISATCDIPVAASDSGYVDPKTVGACITYGRRYTLSCVLGIITEEDNDAGAPPPPAKGKIKPKLGAKEFELAKARIARGDQNVVTKCALYFDLTEDQEHELQNLQLDVEANQDPEHKPKA